MPVACATILLNACSAQPSASPSAPQFSATSPAPVTASSPRVPTITTTPLQNTRPAPQPTSVSPTIASPATPLFTASPTTGVLTTFAVRLVVLAKDLSKPDDLAVAPDGSIYFSDIGDASVKRLDPPGGVTRVVSGIEEPEGIVFLPDGSLVVAEQAKNRLLRYDLSSRTLTTFLNLVNKTGKAGIDGIAFDSSRARVIVPDSPNGTILSVGTDGKNVRVLGRGLARPTGAAVESDGSVLVAEEDGDDVRRLRPDGTSQIVARVPMPDDVLVDQNGDIYANSLADGAVHLTRAADGQDYIFWRGLAGPQGLAWTGDGNLLVAEAGNHRIIELIIR